MKCEQCGHGKQKVPYTMTDLDTEITRMRQCKQCGKTWPTVEITQVAYEELRKRNAKS